MQANLAWFDFVKVPDDVPQRGPSHVSLLITHLNDRHGFGFEDGRVPLQSALDELHADLHGQESEHHLPSHRHRWEVIELHSGRCKSRQFDSGQEAQDWAVRTIGPEAAKEYVSRLAWEVPEP